ncbi:MAG: PHP domain-containing protein [Candidatus Tectomicrobia bacterium]|uniref:PHP domain-containing protein n=1 Tax=Tectimicrobiota bacterium TaxID=2528274 RepID=A0A937VXG1_UNCTE|nr:PHP domain-containing protein [Candidatus Tectomicrobia bacterium]
MTAWRLRVDLHMHTTYSDGLDTPTQLVAKAARHGLHSIAITDHDILTALPEAQAAGFDCGVEVLAGVELTVQYQAYDDIHMLGYCFDPTDPALQARLSQVQQHRVQRGVDMLERINTLLIAQGKVPLDSQRVLQSARGALTRPHLAQALIAQGYANGVQHAFEQFLIPCNVPKAALSPEEAFALVEHAGGVCVLAHPGTLSTDPEVLHPLLATFKAMGLVGLEVYHHRHYPDTIALFQDCATRYDLVATGGSDYHGRPEGAVLGQIAPGYEIPGHVLGDLQRVQAALR